MFVAIATNKFNKTRCVALLFCLIMAWLIGCIVTYFSKATVVTLIAVVLVILSLTRIKLAICLFIFLCPFHFLVKEIYPGLITDLWREIFIFCIFTSWFFQVCLGDMSLPRKNILNEVIVVYIIWGMVTILRSYNLLGGLAGFRFLFAFVPLYFIALSTINGEEEIRRYVNVIVISGFIVAFFAIVQFTFVSLLKIVPPGTFIDFSRKYASHVSIVAAGVPFERAISFLASPNELGIFLSICLVFLLVGYYLPSNQDGVCRKRLLFAIIVVFIGLLLSMSRSSIIAFGISIAAISFVRKRAKFLLIMLTVFAAFALIFPMYFKALFKPVYSLSDPYFTVWTGEGRWGPLMQAPFFGHGFSVTYSAAEKLGLAERGRISIGGVDAHFFQTSSQIGLVGFFLQSFVWVAFLRYSYLAAKSSLISVRLRSIATANFGIFLGLMIGSLHSSPFEYVSTAAIYYVLGAVSTFIYYKAQKAKVESIDIIANT